MELSFGEETVWQDLSSITGQTIKRFLSFVRSLHQRHAKGLSSLWNGMAMLGKKTSEREQKTPGERRLGSGRKEKERLTAAQTVKPERILSGGRHRGCIFDPLLPRWTIFSARMVIQEPHFLFIFTVVPGSGL